MVWRNQPPAKPPKKPVLEHALELLSRKTYARAALASKLKKAGHAMADVQAALVRLEELNYLDDAQLAVTQVEKRSTFSHWGPRRIAQELAQHQLHRQPTVAPAMAGVAWQNVAQAALAKRFSQPLPVTQPEKQKELARRLGFLQRRGFSLSQARAALKAACQTADFDDTDI